MRDVVIVGAGIVGAACAYELTEAGLSVAVLDENEPGAGATSAGMGHLLVLDDPEALFALTRYSMELWRSLAPALPSECKYWQCGTVWVAVDEDELKFAEQRQRYFESHGVRAEMVDAKQLAELEPNLRPDLAGALFVPGDAAVHPATAARFLLNRAQRQGAKIITGHAAFTLNDAGAHLSGGAMVSGHALINATGAAASALTPGLPIRSRKGHIALLNVPSRFIRHQVLELGYVKSTQASEGDSVVFNVRERRNGELLVGSSRQYGSEDPRVEPAILERILSRAIEYIPALAEAPEIESWAGFRAGTPDGLPLIGRCPGFERVYAATGHEGVGATASLGTARLLTDEILKRSPAIAPDPYRPSRFNPEQM